MADRPICEVCGKPEAIYEDYEADLAPPDTLCWAEANGGHSPQHAINALREARAERDRLRALLAAYGRAVEEEGKRLWVLENEDELVLVVADTKNEAEYEGESYTGNTFPRVRELSLGDGVVLHERKQP